MTINFNFFEYEQSLVGIDLSPEILLSTPGYQQSASLFRNEGNCAAQGYNDEVPWILLAKRRRVIKWK